MFINRASKQLKSMTLNKQIVIGKDPKVKWKNTLFVSRKKRLIPTYKSILFNSSLKSNLYFPSSTLTDITYLFLQCHRSILLKCLSNGWQTTDQPSILQLSKKLQGLGISNQLVYFVSLSVYDILSTQVNSSKIRGCRKLKHNTTTLS